LDAVFVLYWSNQYCLTYSFLNLSLLFFHEFIHYSLKNALSTFFTDAPIDTRTFTRPKKSANGEPKRGRIIDLKNLESELLPVTANGRRSSQETPPTNGCVEGDWSEINSRTSTRQGSARAKRSLFTQAQQINLADARTDAVDCGSDVDSVRCNGGEAMTDYSDGNGWGTADGVASARFGGSCRRLSEVADVQILAKVQEES
jgi:hypothetical protein